MIFSEIASFDIVIVLVVIVVLVFGGKAIPKFARNLGSAKNEFEKGLKQAKDEAQSHNSDEK
jgi:TatA/E family protein of Tat protein translocase